VQVRFTFTSAYQQSLALLLVSPLAHPRLSFRFNLLHRYTLSCMHVPTGACILPLSVLSIPMGVSDDHWLGAVRCSVMLYVNPGRGCVLPPAVLIAFVWLQTEVQLEPRYPLLGGWKTEFTVGYSLPLADFLFRTQDGRRRLNITFGCPLRDVVVDHLALKVSQGRKPLARDHATERVFEVVYWLARLPDTDYQCFKCLTRTMRQQAGVLLWWTHELPCSKKGSGWQLPNGRRQELWPGIDDVKVSPFVQSELWITIRGCLSKKPGQKAPAVTLFKGCG
jgi:hypothetical protein